MEGNSTSVRSGSEPQRYLILCCDGTGNIWGNGHDTNVVKIARFFEKSDQQLLYYDPGVGTTDNFPPIGAWNRLKASVRRFIGLALALGIYDDIGRGYEFVVDNYRAGDRLCFFGFSRGAFTARSIAGMVNTFGVVRPSARPMIPVMLRTYFFPTEQTGASGKRRKDIADDIRENFCSATGREASNYFVGVWDTVATVGGLRNLKITSDSNIRPKRVRHVRHAVALDEHRAKYEPRLYTAEGEKKFFDDQTFEQVWFSGCHSDVGGSYAEAELSDITLRWMIEQASGVGIRFSSEANRIVGNAEGMAHDEVFGAPWWSLTGLSRRARERSARIHDSVARRESAAERRTSVWRPLVSRPLFWLLLGCTVLVGLLPALHLALAGGIDTHGTLLAHAALVWKYQAWPSLYLSDTSAFGTALAQSVTLWDFLLIPAYVSLMALLIVHARRPFIYSPQADTARRVDHWMSRWPLIILALADVAENVGVLFGATARADWRLYWAAFVGLCSSVKLVALAIIILYVLAIKAIGWRRRGRGSKGLRAAWS